ncbi:hypothetical protein C5167_048539 [Papaver somniferum]|uniref:Superoxide dismutase copper chaperone n=1 Tax=Papaver somniferum TaxID=3469 RepID=A0A4Y7KLT3_PAPSO|nr:copper chaperone for superoxide dismutase, chloroplastic-like [Papaver somniferum]RZC73058.1 hypothetical protein C5167_048539 [Papaver somniferum]
MSNFLRTLTSASTSSSLAILPVAFAVATLSSSSSDSHNLSLCKTLKFPSLSTSFLKPNRFAFSNNSSSFSPPVKSSLQMDTISSPAKVLPELLTEFMVDMKCEGCVKAVNNKLVTVDGVKGVEVDLSNQVVRVLGSSPVKKMADALEETGKKARLIGQGSPEDFLVSAAVAEFKGPDIFGVVRVAQVSMELARIEANFSGLSPGKHGWTINEFGDLTRGAASTGKVFNPIKATGQPLGDLGTLDALGNGEASFTGAKQMLRVADLIGRAIVVYETEDKSDSGVAAAVIARSAGVGENYKKLCTCDGTTIWEADNTSFTPSKV